MNNFTSGLIQRRNYIPYVIRLQLTVLPYHRREPYDLFVDLKMALMDPKKEGYHLPSIIIIPLLVTDSIEESSENITKEAISRLQAQLSAGVGPAELTASVQHAIDSIKTSLSNRPNSLFAIGKLGTGDDAGIRVRIGANRFGDEFELEPKTHSISFVALVSRDTFEVNKDVLTRSMVIYASPTYRYALPTSLNTTKEQTAKEITGATVADTFVLEAAPKVGSGPTPDSEIWCPPDQTVVVTENSDGAQGSIYGVRDWGSRPVHGYLNAYSTDNGKLIASFASKSAFRDVDGTIPLRFSDFSDALDKKTTKIWKLDIQVDRLRTDELYPSDNHPKEHPWVECGPPLKAVVVPNKKPLTGSADASGARTAPQKHGTSAPGAGSSSPEPKTSSKNSNASGAAPK